MKKQWAPEALEDVFADLSKTAEVNLNSPDLKFLLIDLSRQKLNWTDLTHKKWGSLEVSPEAFEEVFADWSKSTEVKLDQPDPQKWWSREVSLGSLEVFADYFS